NDPLYSFPCGLFLLLSPIAELNSGKVPISRFTYLPFFKGSFIHSLKALSAYIGRNVLFCNLLILVIPSFISDFSTERWNSKFERSMFFLDLSLNTEKVIGQVSEVSLNSPALNILPFSRVNLENSLLLNFSQ